MAERDVTTRIQNDFTYHPPFGNQPKRYQELREQAEFLAGVLIACCPDSRELSLALTNLEQALFWGEAAIARNEVP